MLLCLRFLADTETLSISLLFSPDHLDCTYSVDGFEVNVPFTVF